MSLRRLYETTFIVNAALEDADIDNVLNKVKTYVENHGGLIQEVNKWGRRRLAYPINKKYNGYYIHLVYDAAPSTIPILERFLVLEDTVLRHLTLILPKKLKDYRAKRAIEEGIAYSAINPESQNIKKQQANADAQANAKPQGEVKAQSEVKVNDSKVEAKVEPSQEAE